MRMYAKQLFKNNNLYSRINTRIQTYINIYIYIHKHNYYVMHRRFALLSASIDSSHCYVMIQLNTTQLFLLFHGNHFDCCSPRVEITAFDYAKVEQLNAATIGSYPGSIDHYTTTYLYSKLTALVYRIQGDSMELNLIFFIY